MSKEFKWRVTYFFAKHKYIMPIYGRLRPDKLHINLPIQLETKAFKYRFLNEEERVWYMEKIHRSAVYKKTKKKAIQELNRLGLTWVLNQCNTEVSGVDAGIHGRIKPDYVGLELICC